MVSKKGINHKSTKKSIVDMISSSNRDVEFQYQRITQELT